jgi:hypothetical protein
MFPVLPGAVCLGTTPLPPLRRWSAVQAPLYLPLYAGRGGPLPRTGGRRLVEGVSTVAGLGVYPLYLFSDP